MGGGVGVRHRSQFGRCAAAATVLVVAVGTARGTPFAYVGNYRSGTISVLDGQTRALRTSLGVGGAPYGIAVPPAGGRLFLSDPVAGTLSIIDAASGAVTATAPAGGFPLGVALDAFAERVYATSYLDGDVHVFDATTGATLGTLPAGAGAYGVAVNPVPTVLVGGPTWELVQDSGLPSFALVVLGELNGDLYVFGSQVESAGALAGVFRYRDGVLTKIGDAPGNDYNAFLAEGAVTYQGRLYIGDRRSGNLYRLDLADDGSGTVSRIGKVGGEDVFPGPIAWGRLWLGTYGRGGTAPLNPGVYAYDGTIVTLSKELVSLDIGGSVSSLVFHGGRLWASGRNFEGTAGEIWSTGDGAAWRLEHTGAPYVMAEWHGEIYGSPVSVNGRPPLPQFFVWRNGWTPVTNPYSATGSVRGLLPFGNALLAFPYYETIAALEDARVSMLLGMGDGAGRAGIMSARAHDGYLWVTTAQTVGLYRHPVARLVYVTNHLAGTVSILDPIAGHEVATTPVGAGPVGVAIDPSGRRAYVANFFADSVSVLDAASGAPLATIPVGTNPLGVAIAPSGSPVFVTNHGSKTVSVIDADTDTVVATVPVGNEPHGIAVDPSDGVVVVANEGDGTVSVIDVAGRSVTATVSVGSAPSALGTFVGGPAPALCVPPPDPIGCDDGDTCSTDSCGPLGRCVHVRIDGCCHGDADCSAGDACIAAASCVDHVCVAGPARPCDDADPCTTDSCGDTCRHEELRGRAGILCRLEAIDIVLAATPPRDVKPRIRNRLRRRIAAVRKILASRSGDTIARAPARRAGSGLKAFAREVRRRAVRGDVEAALADSLIADAAQAYAGLASLKVGRNGRASR